MNKPIEPRPPTFTPDPLGPYKDAAYAVRVVKQLREALASAEQEREVLRLERIKDAEFIDWCGNLLCAQAFGNGLIEAHNEHVRAHSTCAFCGEEGPRTPEAMEAHASKCQKHPLSIALARLGLSPRQLWESERVESLERELEEAYQTIERQRAVMEGLRTKV